MKRPTPKQILATACGVILLILAIGLYVWQYVTSPYGGSEAAWIYLPPGTTRAALTDSLTSSLGNRTAKRVMSIYGIAAKDTATIYGAYRIEPGTQAKDIARRLVRHRQTPVRVTFNNIRTLDLLAERLSRRMAFSADEFLAACDSILPPAGFATAEFPAAFLPDTYEFYWTQTAGATVERLLETRNTFWNANRRARARKLGLTPIEVATLASIAEEETNNAEERGTVARLYLNRLNRGMKLQADPTVKFATGNFALRRILSEHLKIPSPYNTYLHHGLPPGPIRIAAATTLQTVLDAPANDYLYMCAKEDFSGRHNFARDYATHRANARRYQQALNARGIK